MVKLPTNQNMALRYLLILSSVSMIMCNTSNTTAESIDAEHQSVGLPDAHGSVLDTMPIDRSISYIMGAFDPAVRPEFVKVDSQYADRQNLYLRKDTYGAFKRMHDAAKKEGISLIIRSATRNFEYQKSIWERKWKGATKLEGNLDASKIKSDTARALAILRYSSMPGTSRHHWGTDIDLNAFNNAYFETGEGQKEYSWLLAHASQYGFCQPYTAKGPERPFGYNEEKWHWSYIPVSRELLKYASTSMNNSMIKGFHGAEVAGTIDVVARYVLGVHRHCKENSEN